MWFVLLHAKQTKLVMQQSKFKEALEAIKVALIEKSELEIQLTFFSKLVNLPPACTSQIGLGYRSVPYIPHAPVILI